MAEPAFALDAPTGFNCTGCSSYTLTWSWTGVDGEEGYTIFDNGADTAVVSGIAADSTTAVETGLDPNTTYACYIKAYNIESTATRNCSALYSGCTSASIKIDEPWGAGRFGGGNIVRGYVKFDLSAFSPGTDVTNVSLFAYNVGPHDAVNFDIKKLGIDPATSTGDDLIADLDGGTVYLFCSSEIGWNPVALKEQDLYPAAETWVEDAINSGADCCSLGIRHPGSPAAGEFVAFTEWNYVPEPDTWPFLKVTYGVTFSYSGKSNSAAGCTLAATPSMCNTAATFTAPFDTGVTVRVGLNGNPDGTVMELFYAPDSGGAPGAWTSNGSLTTGYSWEVVGLTEGVSYWFKARAQSWHGAWTDNCALTVWMSPSLPAAPMGFVCTGCTSATLTWYWYPYTGEDGFDIFDNDTDTAVVSGIAANAATTIETGLSPNTTYVRYIKAYTGSAGAQNCSALFSCYTADEVEGPNHIKFDGDLWAGLNFDCAYTFYGYVKFDLSAFSPGTDVTNVRLFAYCSAACDSVTIDIKKLGIDPEPALPAELAAAVEGSTVYLFNDSQIGYTPAGYKVQDLYSEAETWVENAIDGGTDCCSLGIMESDAPAIDEWVNFRKWDYGTPEERPVLEVTTGLSYTCKSNVAEGCTAANIPAMDNTGATFTYASANTITVQVGDNGNPGGTVIELFCAPDSGGAPGTWASKGTLTTGYSWDVTGLDTGTPYWFKARAQNWAGCWTDYCAVTTWSTLSLPPSNFRSTGCSTNSLTWAWDDYDGEDAFDIFDNDTDIVLVIDIAADATTTIETELSPNTSYRRYIRAYQKIAYDYAESESKALTSGGADWVDACVLPLNAPEAGDHLVIATAQAEGSEYEARFIRDAEEIHYARTDTINADAYESFMSMEVLTADGTSDYAYKLQVKQTGATMTNAAIIALKLPTGNYNFVHNATEMSTSASGVLHTTLTVTPPGESDYLALFASANWGSVVGQRPMSEFSGGWGWGSSWRMVGAPGGVEERFIHAAFWPMESISSDQDLTLELSGVGGTAYMCRSNIAAFRLSDSAWAGYACNSDEGPAAGGTTLVSRTFTPAQEGKYLILASCWVSVVGGIVRVSWDLDSARYDTMEHVYNSVNVQFVNFAGMRSMYLSASEHTFSIEVEGAGNARDGCIVALPLGTKYSARSNVAEACTLANIPTMDNTAATFTFANANTITVQVGDNGNSGGTEIELLCAPDSGGAPGTWASKGTLTTGYSWDVTGLGGNITYWFKARAKNWAGILTDCSSLTTWCTFLPPQNFRCIGCSTDSLTWAWDDAVDEEGFDIFDNDTEAVVVEDVAADATTTVETGLSPNTIYVRYVEAYNIDALNCSALYSCVTEDTTDKISGNFAAGKNATNKTYRGYVKFDLSAFSPGTAVRNVRLFAYRSNGSGAVDIDIKKLGIDPATATAADLDADLDASTVYLFNDSQIGRSPNGYKVQDLYPAAGTWVEDAIDGGTDCCSLGIKDPAPAASVIAWFTPSGDKRPVLEVERKEYSGKSNVVEGCTAANIPTMDNTAATFTFATGDAITVQVGDNGNPAGTGIQLHYATDPAGAWNIAMPAAFASGYLWDVIGLAPDTTYWFKARARNWHGIWTDYCDVTVWRTADGLPTKDFWVKSQTSFGIDTVTDLDNVIGSGGIADDTFRGQAFKWTAGDYWDQDYENRSDKGFSLTDVVNPIDCVSLTAYRIETSSAPIVNDTFNINFWNGAVWRNIWTNGEAAINWNGETKTWNEDEVAALSDIDTWAEVDVFRTQTNCSATKQSNDGVTWYYDTLKLSVKCDSLRVVVKLPDQTTNFGGSPVIEGTQADIPETDRSYTVWVYVVDQDNNARTEVSTGSVEIWTPENQSVGIVKTWTGGCASFTVENISPFTGNYVLPISLFPDYPSDISDTFDITRLPTPQNFRCTDCSSTTLTWAWEDVTAEEGYDIFDNDTDTIVVVSIAASATTTVETGLDPNTSYRRYIKSDWIRHNLSYYYAENAGEVSTTSNTVWESVCTLDIPSDHEAGNYLIIAAMQAKSTTTLGVYGRFRLVRDETNVVNYVFEETDDKYHSFISSEVLSASGSDPYKYQLQIQSEFNGFTTAGRDAAIIAILMPTSNYATIDNLTQGTATEDTFLKHSDVTVTPVGASDDYMVIHASNFRHSDASYHGFSRLYDGSNELTYGVRDPYNANEWFTQGGFSVLKGISSDVTLEAQHHPYSGYTSYEKYVHIAALRLTDAVWSGYADNALYTEQSTTSTRAAVTKTFNVTTPKNYLIMGSCGIGIADSTSSSYTPTAWLEHNCASGTTKLGEMLFRERDYVGERGSFAAMRRLYLAAGEHTVRVRFKTSSASYSAHARCPAVIAVPLKGPKEYSEKSNVAEGCTLATVPSMDNTAATFTFANADTITVQVGDNGNPGGTTIDLEYAKGNADGPTEAFTSLGLLTSGYSWNAASLDAGTSYWFKARAQNWAGTWTGYCDVTVWSTNASAALVLSCIGCASDSLTWAWDEFTGEDGFDIFDNDTDAVVVADIAADATTTVENGLGPNVTYARYIRPYTAEGPLLENCACTENGCGYITNAPDKYTDDPLGIRIRNSRHGFCMFNIENVSDTWTVTGVKLYLYCHDAGDAGQLLDIKRLNLNPLTATDADLKAEIISGTATVFVDDSTEGETTGAKVFDLTLGDAPAWIGECLDNDWCALGIYDGVTTNDARFTNWDCATTELRPWLEVEYSEKTYTGKSNVVVTCTAANIPFMDNTAATFTDQTNDSITVSVGLNGNPSCTSMTLWYSAGTPSGPGGTWIDAGANTADYTWDVTALNAYTSYWFKSAAQNWRGCWTDCCSITVWSTAPGPPTNFRCIDCTSVTLTWAWDNNGDGFTIYDNVTDLPVISCIPADATYTVETGLDFNTTYSRYIKAYVPLSSVIYYYAENQSSTSGGAGWTDACTLTLNAPEAGDYLVIGTAQAEGSDYEGRFIRGAEEIHYARVDTESDNLYQSFMSMEVLTADGTSDYTYKLQVKQTGATMTNAAIIAVKFPTGNYDFVHEAGEISHTLTSWKLHTTLTVTPTSESDYLALFTSAHWTNDDTTQARSQFYTTSPDITNLSYREPEGFGEDHDRFIHAGFWPLESISNPHDVTLSLAESGSWTAYMCRSHIAAFRLSDSVWSGYIGNTHAAQESEGSTTPKTLVSRTFTPDRETKYLVLASCQVRISSTAYRARAWWEIDSTRYDATEFTCDASDTERATFVGMRCVTLPAAEHTLSIKFVPSDAAATAYASAGCIIAIPLENGYSGKSDVVPTCTAAVIPSMTNTSATFTFANSDTITVQVGDNGNPGGTTIDLEYAKGDAGGPTEAFTSLDPVTSGYIWNATGLDGAMSYWFRARAQNWRGCWTDYCDVTVWSTFAGPPENFRCIDCTSVTLTWAWDNNGGSGFTICDNDTDLPIIPDIPAGVTFTVETGLAPNTTYSRYITAWLLAASTTYYYAENLPVQTFSKFDPWAWKTACTLTMTSPPDGDYLVIASMQGKTVGSGRTMLRFLRESTPIGKTYANTWDEFRSFLASEVVSLSGGGSRTYRLQAQNNGDHNVKVMYASIIAIKLPSASFNSIDNLTTGYMTGTAWVKHSGVTVTPPASGGDYMIVHSGCFNSESDGWDGYSRLRRMDTSDLTYARAQSLQVSSDELFLQGGFSMLKGISADVSLEDQYKSDGSTNTVKKQMVHIAAVRLGKSIWGGYADNACDVAFTTDSTTGATAATRTFTVPKAQNYLIMASCNIKIQTLDTPTVWWEYENSSGTYAYDRMCYVLGWSTDRAAFAAIRRLYLETGEHTIRIMLKTDNSDGPATAYQQTIIALPLEGGVPGTDPSNVVEACTWAAIPSMDNTPDTFIDCTSNTITVQLGDNGNPGGTLAELFYAMGNETDPIDEFSSAGWDTIDCQWVVTGLTPDTSYWFKARAQNWVGILTDNCAVTVWSTVVFEGVYTWQGTTNTDWAESSNWSPSPGAETVGQGALENYSILIESAANMPEISSLDLTIGNLVINSGNSCTVGASCTISITGDVTGGGNLSITGAGAVFDSEGEFDLGNLSMTAGGLYIADDDPSITGTMTCDAGTVTYDGDTSVGSILEPTSGGYYNLTINKNFAQTDLENCACVTDGSGYVYDKYDNGAYTRVKGSVIKPGTPASPDKFCWGWAKFDLGSGSLPNPIYVAGARLFFRVDSTDGDANQKFDLNKVTSDPLTCGNRSLALQVQSGTIFTGNSTEHQATGYKVITLNTASCSWIEQYRTDDWCALGFYEHGDQAKDAELASGGGDGPFLEVEYSSDPSPSVTLTTNSSLTIAGDFTIAGGRFLCCGSSTTITVTNGKLIGKGDGKEGEFIFGGSGGSPTLTCDSFELGNGFVISGDNVTIIADEPAATSFLNQAVIMPEKAIKLDIAGNFEMANSGRTQAKIFVSDQLDCNSFLIKVDKDFTMTNTSLIESLCNENANSHYGNDGTAAGVGGGGGAYWGHGGNATLGSPANGGTGADEYHVQENWWDSPPEMGSEGGKGESGAQAAGGKAGGAIQIIVGGDYTVSGIVTAQGQNGADNAANEGAGGGGSGGYIYIELTCSSGDFIRAGTLLTVRGGHGGGIGNNADWAGGGGGGGLIYIKTKYAGAITIEEINGWIPGVGHTPWEGDLGLLGLGGGLGGSTPNSPWDNNFLGGGGSAYIKSGDNEITFVRLYSLRAEGYDNGIVTFWRSGIEIDHAWYNVHRSTEADGAYMKINPAPITGLGTSYSGGEYYFIDTTAEPDTTYYYLVEDVEFDGDSTFHGPVHASVVPGAPNPVGDPSLYVNGGSTDDSDIPFIPPVPHGPSMPGGVVLLPGVVQYLTGCSNVILLEIFASEPILVPVTNSSGQPATRIDLAGAGHLVTDGVPMLPEMQITLESLGAYVSMRLLEADLRGIQVVDNVLFNDPVTAQVVINRITPSRPKPGERRGASWKDRRARFRWSRPVWTDVTEEREVPYGSPGAYYPDNLVTADPVEFLGSIPKLTVRARPVQYRHVTRSIRSFSRLLVELTFSGTPVPGNDSTSPEGILALPAGSEGFKIFIRDDGLYGLTYADFFAAGMDLSFDPRNLKLFRQGIEIPIEVSGESDGTFDPGDAVTFFGRSYLDLYCDVDVYFLFADVTRGIRVESRSAAPQALPVSGDWASATFMEKKYWFFNNTGSGMPMEERWLGPVIMSSGLTQWTSSFDIPYLAPTSGNSTLTVYFQPDRHNPWVNPDHHVKFYVNGTQVGDLYYDGHELYIYTVEFDSSILDSAATNNIVIWCMNDTGAGFDLMYITRIIVDYPRTWEADGGRLVATTGLVGTHAATGFALGAPIVYDVTDQDVPVRLMGGILDNAGEFRFEAEADHTYAFSSVAALATPNWVTNEPTRLRAPENACDYVIITHNNFRNAAEFLGEHRRQYDGLSVLVTDVTNVYDEYTGGRIHPLAIRSFVLESLEKWAIPPQAVLLVGDSSADTLGYASGGTNRNYVPTVFYDTGVGYTMSDQQLVISEDNGLPLIGIGRLPVLSAFEAEQVVDKIIAYDLNAFPGDWTDRILIAADQPDYDAVVSDYHVASDMYASCVPLTYTIEKAYFTGSDPSRNTVKDQIRNAFADGSLIVNWTGHGAYDVWSEASLLDSGIVGGFPQQPGQPFVIVSNCLTGAIDYPKKRTLAEALLIQESGGAIGVFASGGGMGSSGQFYLNQAVYQSIFIAGDRRFCDIVKSSLELARTMFVPDGDLNSFNLFADPMQRLKE